MFFVLFIFEIFEVFCDYFRVEIPGKSARWFETISKHGPRTQSEIRNHFKGLDIFQTSSMSDICTCIWSFENCMFVLNHKYVHFNSRENSFEWVDLSLVTLLSWITAVDCTLFGHRYSLDSQMQISIILIEKQIIWHDISCWWSCSLDPD